MEIKINEDLTFDDKQRAAIKLCADTSKRLVAITGPAGSGKTTLIRLVHAACREAGIPVAVAAPTGKAARRIKEATGIDALTVHKLLEYNRPGQRDPETGEPLDPTKPSRNRQRPLDQFMIIVDEYAMINEELHNNLMAALPSGGCIRAFGDVAQLPPIENGFEVVNGKTDRPSKTPFERLLGREGDSVTLDTVYRQAEGSNILSAADKIRKGHTPPLNEDLGDFYVKLTDRPIDLLKTLVSQGNVDFRQITNQIITPSKKSWVGTNQLNGILRNLLNPDPDQELELKRHSWDQDGRVTVGVGDKVVCTSNTYDLRDYFERYTEWDEEGRPYSHSFIPTPDNKMMLNGETGVVLQIYPDGGMDIDFGDRIVEVPEKYSEYWQKRDTVIDTYPTRDIALAYALTTHKCQGSEYESVIYVLNKSTLFVQSRQNMYTAVTRARKQAIVLTDQISLRTSILRVRK